MVGRGGGCACAFYESPAAGVCVGVRLAGRGGHREPFWRRPVHAPVAYLILGIVDPPSAFTAGIHVLKQLSPFTVILTVNLEPVYTILIALMIWPESERMHPGSYIGIALILACISLNGWRQRRMNVKMVKPRPLAQG